MLKACWDTTCLLHNVGAKLVFFHMELHNILSGEKTLGAGPVARKLQNVEDVLLPQDVSSKLVPRLTYQKPENHRYIEDSNSPGLRLQGVWILSFWDSDTPML